jgi:hypothetical protein
MAERVIHPSPIRTAPRGEAATSPGHPGVGPASGGEDVVDLSEAVRRIGVDVDRAAADEAEASSLDDERRSRILKRIGEGSYDWPESRISIMKRLAKEIGLLP